eukprot:COSAG02_NODE_209_length_28965_cov_18.680143_18_plen_69_part_00
MRGAGANAYASSKDRRANKIIEEKGLDIVVQVVFELVVFYLSAGLFWIVPCRWRRGGGVSPCNGVIQG